MKFQQMKAGTRLSVGPVKVTEQEILDFARKFDNQWFHVDSVAAQSGPWKGLIASGWHTCAMAMQLFSEHVLRGSGCIGSPGVNNLKWSAPVRPGDTLTLDMIALEKRISASNPNRGVVHWRWLLHNQHDVVVLELDAVNLFDLQAAPPDLIP